MIDVIVVGYGYIGRRIAAAERARGHQVAAMIRSTEAHAAAQQQGVVPIEADLDHASGLASLNTRGATLYYLAPPPGEGKVDTRMRNLLAALTPDRGPGAFVYISTTGVYGDCRGNWVTEDSPTRPTLARGQRRLDAEQALLHWAQEQSTRVVILRVGGIYGPDRLPLARLQKGEPMVDDPLRPSFINVIHAEDLVNICLAAADCAQNGAIYNVSDGQPTTMMQYFRVIASKAGLPAPPTISFEQAKQILSPGMLSYVEESRRVDNKKLLKELDIKLRYPNAAVGVAAALACGSESAEKVG